MDGAMSAQPKPQLVNELAYSDSEDSAESCEKWEAAHANEDSIASTVGFLLGDEDLPVIRETVSEDSQLDESEIDEIMVGREIEEAVERAKKHIVLDELREKMCSPEKGELYVDTSAMVVTPPKQRMPESILRQPHYSSPTLSLPDLDDEEPFDHPMKQVSSTTDDPDCDGTAQSSESQNDENTLEADDEYEDIPSNQAWDEDDSSFSSDDSPFFGYDEEKPSLLESVDMFMDKIAGVAFMDDETVVSYTSDSSTNNQLFGENTDRSIDILTDQSSSDALWEREESRRNVPAVVFMAEPALREEPDQDCHPVPNAIAV